MTSLRQLVDTERERFGAAGTAVAVVAGGEVRLTYGSGVRDLGTGSPVTASTLFPISSNTKAFTAATLCVLHAAGDVDLDAPVRTYVPWFRMSDPVRAELVTTRDLLAHRTGLPRHDLVWAGDSGLDLEAATRAVAHLDTSEPFRHGWLYNNLLYDVAGYVTEVVTGEPWRDAVRRRLLDPLGMSATGFSARDAAGGEDFAHGYDDRGVAQVLPPDSLLGPPGCVVANADDLARWLLARLGGEVDGVRALSDEALLQLHTPVVTGGFGAFPMPGRHRIGYALGCQAESYRGHRLVHHGGSDPGWSSHVLVAPDDGVGVAVLTNLDTTALAEALGLCLLDQLLDLEPVDWGERYATLTREVKAGAAAASAALASSALRRPGLLVDAACAGTYQHPAYGTLAITTSDDGQGLRPEFHHLGDIVGLEHRDGDGWDLTLFDGLVRLPLEFRTSANGSVCGLAVALEPSVAPIEFIRVVDEGRG